MDHFGSTEALTDAIGKVTLSTSHDFFGKATSSIVTHYHYTGHFTPFQKMEQWQRKKPYLFVRTVDDQTGLDIYVTKASPQY